MAPIPSSLTLNYDAILSTTLFNYRRTLEDAISTANAFLFIMLMKRSKADYKIINEIGDRMMMPLMYELGNADSYSGYDVLDVTPADGISMAFFNWAQAAVPISISGLEEKKNRGEAKIIACSKRRCSRPELGSAAVLQPEDAAGRGHEHRRLDHHAPTRSPANGSNFVDPLPYQVQFAPTGSVDPGNIQQSSNTWWQNQTLDFPTGTCAATTYAGFLKSPAPSAQPLREGPGRPPRPASRDAGHRGTLRSGPGARRIAIRPIRWPTFRSTTWPSTASR